MGKKSEEASVKVSRKQTKPVQYSTVQYWATRPCAVSVEECSVGRRTGNAGLEMKNI
jgi:hypothetical protein